MARRDGYTDPYLEYAITRAEGRREGEATAAESVRVLHETIADLREELSDSQERADALASLLAALTADEWAGWGFDEMEGAFECFYCHQYTEEHDGGYQHTPDCPLTRARVLLGTQPQETAEE